MPPTFLNALSEATASHIYLSPTRRETLCWLVLLIVRYGTISLWRLSAHVATMAQIASVRRRFYRFFQFVHLDEAAVARLIVSLLGLSGKQWTLALDRTNWDFGRTTINILMLSVQWNDMGIPLIWTILPKAGNSSMAERICLLDRLRTIFPDMNIASLTGDREFIGAHWMEYLANQKIPFALRLRENQLVAREGYATWSLTQIAHRLKRGETMIIKEMCCLGTQAPHVRIAIMRLKSGELLCIACLARPRRALAIYRQRWTIETLFANLKTRGFNMEETHMTNPKKLSTLIAIMAIATTLAGKTGNAANKAKPTQIKKHGRKAVSTFARGIAALRKICAIPENQKIITFFKILFYQKYLGNPLLRLNSVL